MKIFKAKIQENIVTETISVWEKKEFITHLIFQDRVLNRLSGKTININHHNKFTKRKKHPKHDEYWQDRRAQRHNQW